MPRRAPRRPTRITKTEKSLMPELIINGPGGRIEARYHHEDDSDSPIALDPAPAPAVRRDHEQSSGLHALSHVRSARLFGAAVQFPRRRTQSGDLGQRPRRTCGRRVRARLAADSSSPTPRAAGSPASRSAPGSPCALMRRPEVEGFICVAPPSNLYDFSSLRHARRRG